MKKTIASVLVLGMVLVGCGAEQVPETVPTEVSQTMETVTVPTVPEEPGIPLYAVALEPVVEVLRAEDGVELFSCTYPRLRVVLEGCPAEPVVAAELERRVDELLKEAEALGHSAELAYDGQEGWSPYHARADYATTRLDGAVLSMFARFEYHSGGIHPAQSGGSVTYDLTDGRVLTLGDILVEGWSGEDMARRVGQALEDRAAALYPGYEEAIRGRFAEGADSSTAWYLTGEGLCFHFAPYEIAGASAGVVTAQIPYQELEGILRQEYLPRQETGKGSVYARLQLEEPEEGLMTVCLDPQGERVRIVTDGTVTDLRVELGRQTEGSFVPEALVFAAGTIGSGDGLYLQAELQDRAIRVRYVSGGQEVSSVVVYDAGEGRMIEI